MTCKKTPSAGPLETAAWSQKPALFALGFTISVFVPAQGQQEHRPPCGRSSRAQLKVRSGLVQGLPAFQERASFRAGHGHQTLPLTS